MSLTIAEEIRCPCGEVFESEVYQSVSVEENPELKESILAGEFNLVSCPQCKNLLFAERFVLYHDKSRELLAFVYPQAMENNSAAIEEDLRQKYALLQADLDEDEKLSYTPFLLFGMDRLCDLIRIEEEIDDEVQIALNVCHTRSLPLSRLRLSVARKKNIPPLLPVAAATDNFRLKLIEGLKNLLEENHFLKHYQNLLDRILADADWTLEPSDFLPASE